MPPHLKAAKARRKALLTLKPEELQLGISLRKRSPPPPRPPPPTILLLLLPHFQTKNLPQVSFVVCLKM